MRVVTTLETESATWGRTDQGRWVRWNDATQQWEEQSTGPWVTPDPADLVEPQANTVGAEDSAGIPSASSSDGDAGPLVDGSGKPTPRSPLDDWWMRKFPPYSLARFLFLLVAMLPIMALLVVKDRLAGRHTPFIVYVATAVGTVVFIGIVFLVKPRADGGAGRWARGGTGGVPAVGEPEGTPPAPVLAQAEPIRSVFDPGAGWGRDLLECLSISLPAAIAFAAISIGRSAFRGAGLAIIVGAALLVALIISLRRSVFSVVIVAALGGFGMAGLLELFSAFWGAGGHFIETWLFCTVIAFVFVLPVWLALRRPNPIWGTGSAPGWAYATAGAVISIAAALITRAA